MKKICLLFGILLLFVSANSVLADPYLYANRSFNKNINGVTDFGPYMRDLQRCIQMNWVPPKDDITKRVILLFKIDKTGQLMSSSVYQSSGSPDADRAAMYALQKTAPFKPLPSEFKGESIDIMFTFDYSVWGKTNYKSMHSPIMGENIQFQQTPSSKTYYKNLDETLTVTNKSLIRTSQGYKYIHVLKVKPFFEDAYLWKCKVDCKNRQIGVKKSYEGTVSSTPMHLLGFTQMVNVFSDNVKMQSPDKNKDYLKIYNYVCQP